MKNDFVSRVHCVSRLSISRQFEYKYGVRLPAKKAKHRSQLGKWVAKHEMTCKREKRLCNGTQREVNVYLQTDELDDCIKEYLDVKMLSPVD